MSDSDNEDIPALDDFEGVLNSAGYPNLTTPSNDNTEGYRRVETPTTTGSSVEIIKPKTSDTTTTTGPSGEHRQIPSKKKRQEQTSSFGGFKKGFLFGGTKKRGAERSPTEPPLITVNPKQLCEGSSLRLEEIQTGMMNQDNLLNNTQQWLTDDLVSSFEQNESLRDKLTDPRYCKLIDEIAKNPQQGPRIMRENPKLEELLKNLSGILGTHFSNLADQSSSAAPLQFPALTEEGLGKIDTWFDDPEFIEAFKDPEIQNILSLLKSDPTEGQRRVTNSTLEVKKKLNKLIELGLLGVE